MDAITAEQAAEAAKGLTFEKVWAALMETRERMEKAQEVYRIRMEKAEEESRLRDDASRLRIEKSHEETRNIVAELSKNIGGLGNSLGRLTEALFSPDLWSKFTKLGYTFTKQGPNVKFMSKKKVLAEVDFILENGDYAMLVEVKTELTVDDVKDHMSRIEKVRGYFDDRSDKHILVGAVAGGIVSESVRTYAHAQGLYVIVQTGDSVAIAGAPQGFKAREW